MNIAQSSSLLIDEAPLLVFKSLATLVGLNESIVLQQVHYWLKLNEKAKKENHHIDGRWWTYNTYENWQKENFPFWSVRTVRRVFSDLERRGLLISEAYHKPQGDRTKWYTIDYDALNLLARPCGQIGQTIGSSCPDHVAKLASSSIYTETTTENSTKTNEYRTPFPSQSSKKGASEPLKNSNLKKPVKKWAMGDPLHLDRNGWLSLPKIQDVEPKIKSVLGQVKASTLAEMKALLAIEFEDELDLYIERDIIGDPMAITAYKEDIECEWTPWDEFLDNSAVLPVGKMRDLLYAADVFDQDWFNERLEVIFRSKLDCYIGGGSQCL